MEENSKSTDIPDNKNSNKKSNPDKKSDNGNKNTNDKESSSSKDSKNKIKNNLKQAKEKDIDAEMKESEDLEMMIAAKNEENYKFSFWSADDYLHNYLKDYNILLRYAIEIIIFSIIIMIVPILMIIITKENFDIKLYFIAPDANESLASWLFRRNLYICLVYVADVIIYVSADCFSNVAGYILWIIDLYDSSFCWRIIDSFYTKRWYLVKSLTLLFAFFLSNIMFQHYNLPQISIHDLENVIKTLLLWSSLYCGILFITKFIVGFLTFNVKRQGYTATIANLNYKSFIYNKLEAIAEAKTNGDDIKDLCNNLEHGDDDGIYLEYKDGIFSSAESAKVEANNIYVKLHTKKLTAADIKKYFPKDCTQVYLYFTGADIEKDDTNTITAKVFVNMAKELYRERRDMERTLRDRDSLFDKLDLIFSMIMSYVALIILLLLFKADYKLFMASFGTTFITFSWIFADSIKNIYNCFIFLLVIRPYSIGDKVVIAGDTLYVYKVDLLSTAFMTPYSELVYISNTTLMSMQIHNIARSPAQSETIELAVDASTTYDQAIKLEKLVKKELENQKLFFKNCFFRSITKEKICFEIIHTKNFQNSKQLRLKQKLAISIFRKCLSKCEIKFDDSFIFSGYNGNA